jgi:hypothetical protein
MKRWSSLLARTGSTLPVGSSASEVPVLEMTARAIAARCFHHLTIRGIGLRLIGKPTQFNRSMTSAR